MHACEKYIILEEACVLAYLTEQFDIDCIYVNDIIFLKIILLYFKNKLSVCKCNGFIVHAQNVLY